MHSAVVSSADFVVLHLTAHFLVEFGVKCFVHGIVVVTRFCCLLFGCTFDWNLWPIFNRLETAADNIATVFCVVVQMLIQCL